MAAVTTLNTSLAALASEIKGVKLELTFVRQDMQKLRDCTAAIEGRVCTLEDDWAPIQRDVHYNTVTVAKQAARIDDMKNRMQKNIWSIGILEKTDGKNPVHFIEQWLLRTYGKDVFSSMFCVERSAQSTQETNAARQPSVHASI